MLKWKNTKIICILRDQEHMHICHEIYRHDYYDDDDYYCYYWYGPLNQCPLQVNIEMAFLMTFLCVCVYVYVYM